jgi:hypothetical protein
VPKAQWGIVLRIDLRVALCAGLGFLCACGPRAHLPPRPLTVVGALSETDATVARALDELQTRLREFDPTLADALDGGRRKIVHQLEGLRARFHRAQMQRDRAVLRQLERAATALYPEKSLQERHVNVVSLLARHGRYLIQWVHDAIDLSTNDHVVVYL